MIDLAMLVPSVQDGGWVWRLLGRLHPLAVHFPIALLVAAALVDGWRLIRKRRAPSVLVIYCLFLAAFGAAGSAILGWISAGVEKPDAESAHLLSMHRWLGLGLAAATPLLAALSIRARRVRSPALLHSYRVGLWACVVLMGTVAHYGGELVYGEGYLSSAFSPPPPSEGNGHSPSTAATVPVDFDRDIEPILRSHCVKCHGPEKQKGRLRLDSRELAMKGGISGKIIVPGKATQSPLYALLLEPEEDSRMPPKSNPLTAEKIELIRAWIEQGAMWPDRAQGGP